MNDVPTFSDINVHNSLDEICAANHFCGKTHEQAYALLADNFLNYQEDIMWMGIHAFEYYIEDVVEYIQSDPSLVGNNLSPYVSLIEYRIEEIIKLKNVTKNVIHDSLMWILLNYDKYSIDENIFGNLGDRAKKLKERLR